MTVRQDPLQHYLSKIASERCTVKRKQETTVRAGKEEFTAENAEEAEKSSSRVVVGSRVHSAIRDREFGRPTVTAVFSAIPANRTRISASALIILRGLCGLCGEILIDA